MPSGYAVRHYFFELFLAFTGKISAEPTIQRETLRQIRKNLQRRLMVLLQLLWAWTGQSAVEMMSQHLFMMSVAFYSFNLTYF